MKAKLRKNHNLIFICGLPCSGKSNLAEKLKQKYINYSDYVNVINVDSYIKKSEELLSRVKDMSIPNLFSINSYDKVIIDGLFLTTKHLIDFINEMHKISNYNLKFMKENVKYQIIQFNEDRNACLWNNVGEKRDRNIDIKNLPYEKIDIDLLKKETKVEDIVMLKEVDVIRKSLIQNLAKEKKLTIYFDDIINSERWKRDGVIVDCWGNEEKLREEYPVEFLELRKIIADLLKIDYNKDERLLYCREVSEVFDKSVSIEDYTDYGYYGTEIQYSYFQCHLNQLENLIGKSYVKSYFRKDKIKFLLNY